MIDAMRCLLEIRLTGRPDVAEFLRIPVKQRKPGALDLDHDSVSLEEGVLNIGQIECNLCHVVRDERFGPLEGVAEFPPENVAADKPLVAAHADIHRIIPGIGCIVGIDVDQLDDPVSICARRRDIELGPDRAGDR